jgi:hypothetical protein
MRAIEPKVGQGRFQWNAGGWFGSLLGSTAFMPLGGLMFASQSMALAAVWLVCYATAVACGVFIWTRRASLAPYPAIQCLLLLVGVTSTIAILFALFTRPEFLAHLNATPTQALLTLLVFPGLMLGFFLLERTARRPTT